MYTIYLSHALNFTMQLLQLSNLVTKIKNNNITVEYSDPNEVEVINWHRIRYLCVQHEIEFMNQTFVQFIKQLCEKCLDQQNKQIYF